MKSLFLIVMILASLPAQARGKMKAFSLVDNGSTVSAIKPHIRGCANDMCYGGPGSYMLRPHYSAQKICKQLGLGDYIRGTKVVEEHKVSMVYELIGYYLLERSGPPGAPEGELRKIITSVECEKLN